MDRVTKSLLDAFVEENSLESLPEDQAFEHFCAYLATSEHFSETFATGDIVVGAGGDCGIDSIAIIVNGSIVTNPEEIQDLEEANGFLDATFVFTQAERSSSFETAKIGQFGFGVQDFFSEKPKLPRNAGVTLAGRAAIALYDRSARFRGNPRCFLYYATTGRWTDDQNLVVRRDAVVRDLLDTNLFTDVGFTCLGASEVQALYRKSKNAIATQITFTEKTVVPEIPGVEQAYVGVLPASEFMRLIQNDNEEVITSLFYDNVRHWQEWNPVNSEIQATIQNKDKQQPPPLRRLSILGASLGASGPGGGPAPPLVEFVAFRGRNLRSLRVVGEANRPVSAARRGSSAWRPGRSTAVGWAKDRMGRSRISRAC